MLKCLHNTQNQVSGLKKVNTPTLSYLVKSTVIISAVIAEFQCPVELLGKLKMPKSIIQSALKKKKKKKCLFDLNYTVSRHDKNTEI